MDPVRPDGLRRSQTGRVPKWVVDEANGIAPTEAVPFRSDPRPPGKPRKQRSWTRTTAWIAGAVVLGGLAFVVNSQDKSGETLNVRKPTSPPAGKGEAKDRIAKAVTAATPSTSFRFLSTQVNGTTPIRWSPCRKIHYVVRPEHSPPEGPQLIANAFARLAAATGLVFVNDGATTEPPAQSREPYQPDRYGDRWAPVNVSWATPDEVPDFGVDIAGEAGPDWATAPDGTRTYISGSVALDADYMNRTLRAGDAAHPEAIVLHELGHLIGLAHVNDDAQLMAPRNSGTVVDYATGDLAGLAALGAGPCTKAV